MFKGVPVIHLNIVVRPIRLESQIGHENVHPPTFETRGLHQLPVFSLSRHDILHGHALVQLAVCPLIRLPGVSITRRDPAMRGGGIEHRNDAAARSSGLYILILSRHPIPILVNVVAPLVVHCLSVRPLPPNYIVIGIIQPGMHGREYGLQILTARLF